MKFFNLIVSFSLLIGSIPLKAQTPDFKFHLAFEDATGAKDTLWFIWDSTATNGYDVAFGETPISLTPNLFQVYFQLGLNDTGKVRAKPMNNTLNGALIEAKNYVYPITLRWDSSLFTNNNLPFTINYARLDNDWFFFNNNEPPIQMFNMLTADSVALPKFYYWSEEQFPLNFSIGFYIVNIEENFKSKLVIYPNPVSDKLMVDSEELEGIYSFKIYDIEGKQVVEQQLNSTHNVVNVNHLPNGIYHYKIIAPNQEVLTGKISIVK